MSTPRPIPAPTPEPTPGDRALDAGTFVPGPPPGPQPAPTPQPIPLPVIPPTPAPAPITPPPLQDLPLPIPLQGPIPKHGLHGPNSKMADAQNPWGRLTATRAGWVKLLYNSQVTIHTRADAQQARNQGLRVLVRTFATNDVDVMMPPPDEVSRAIEEFQGLAEVIEVGNEPPHTQATPDGRTLTRWDHAVRMEEIAHNLKARANAAHMQLCVGGWAVSYVDETGVHDEPPPAGDDGLAQRLRAVYNLYDAMAVHNYDPGDLRAPGPSSHLDAWHRAFPDKPLYLTEYGIAYRWLLRDAGVPASEDHILEHSLEKARRYARYLQRLESLDYVVAAFTFIMGGTHDWDKLPGSEDNGYWLPDEGWAAVPQRLTDMLRRALFPLRGPATMSRDRFGQVLQQASSPALLQAPAGTFYDLCTRYLVDPAMALAFFALESTYGTATGAVDLRNWGMLWDRQNNRMGRYVSWQAGLEDWLQRVQRPAYFVRGEPTLATLVPTYRPFGLKQFNNDTNAYIAAARSLIQGWQG